MYLQKCTCVVLPSVQSAALILVCRLLGETQWTISCLLLPGLRADNDRWCSHPGGLTGLRQCATVTAFTIGSSAVMAALALVRPGTGASWQAHPWWCHDCLWWRNSISGYKHLKRNWIFSKGETTRMSLIFLESAPESPKGRVDSSS